MSRHVSTRPGWPWRMTSASLQLECHHATAASEATAVLPMTLAAPIMGWWADGWLSWGILWNLQYFNWWETRGTSWHCRQDSAYIHISIHIHIICQILSAITSHDGLDIAWYCHERPFRIGSSLALAPCSSRVVSYAEHTPAEASFPRTVE